MQKNVVCRSCDLTVSITQIKKHYDCICPRCGRKLLSNNLVKEGDVAIVAFAALIFLFISIIEPFMSISAISIPTDSSEVTNLYNEL